MDSCWCGIFAVGRCTSCSDGVCDKHSSDSGGPLLCHHCAYRRTDAGAAALESAIREALEDRDGRLATIAAVEDPIERFVSAIRFIVRDFHPDEPGEMMGNIRLVDMAARRRRQQEELARVCPEYGASVPEEAFDSKLSWSGAWSSQTIGAWFVERRFDAGIAPDFTLDETAERRLRRGRSMFVDVGRHEGWIIPKARHTNVDHRAVLEDGRIVHAGPRSYEQAARYMRGVLVEHELQVGHLDDMARLLGLPAVHIRRTGVGMRA